MYIFEFHSGIHLNFLVDAVPSPPDEMDVINVGAGTALVLKITSLPPSSAVITAAETS